MYHDDAAEARTRNRSAPLPPPADTGSVAKEKNYIQDNSKELLWALTSFDVNNHWNYNSEWKAIYNQEYSKSFVQIFESVHKSVSHLLYLILTAYPVPGQCLWLCTMRPIKKNNEHTKDILLGTCPTVIQISQQSKRITKLFGSLANKH